MKTIRTFGRMPTLGEMKEYYTRDDVLSFLYNECRIRNIEAAFRKQRWPIYPTSKAHLRDIIDKTIENRIERVCSKGLADPIDSIRLGPFDYLSFHSCTSITSGKKLTGFDTIFEADMSGWRRSFEDLLGVIRLLNDLGVCFRIKYSGVRSLHFMIPFEALPRQFNGKSVLSQQAGIQSKIQEYFRRHCGMEKAHGGKVLRLAYSLNEDNGLVSLPLSSEELSSFRPWEANIYNVTVDKPWHGHIPADASRKTLKFLREVYSDNAKARSIGSRKTSFGLDILPRDRSSYDVRSDESSAKEWLKRLKSNKEGDRAEAAWNLMMMPEPIPLSVVKDRLTDENPDVRWYLTEALQKCLDDEAVSLAGRMFLDDDKFVRISAVDALVLAGENALSTLWNSAVGNVGRSSKDLFSDFIHAISKISAKGRSETIKSFIQSEGSRTVAQSLQEAFASDQSSGRLRQYVRQLKELCRRCDIEESIVFSEAIRLLVPELLRNCSEGAGNPQLQVLALQELNEAIALITIRKIAEPHDIDPVNIRANRMTEGEQEFLEAIVGNALADMSVRQKTRILAIFMLYGKTRLLEPSAKVLLKIGISEAVEAMVEMSRQKTMLPNRLVDAVNLLKQLEPSIERSASANEALSRIAGVGAIPAFAEALENRDMQVRRSAARALAHIDDPAVVPVLVEGIGDKDKVVRREAMSAMERIGQPAVPALVKVLEEGEEGFRRGNAVLVLGKIGGSGVVTILLELLEDDHRDVRAKAASALGATGDAAAVSALMEALKDRYTFVRASAANALGSIGNAVAVTALIEALDDEKSSVRAQVAGALGMIGDPAAVPALIKTLKDDRPWVRACAAMALGNIGNSAAVSALTEIVLKS